jgi:hypothetical protein
MGLRHNEGMPTFGSLQRSHPDGRAAVLCAVLAISGAVALGAQDAPKTGVPPSMVAQAKPLDPAAAAAQLSGSWRFNKELSTGTGSVTNDTGAPPDAGGSNGPGLWPGRSNGGPGGINGINGYGAGQPGGVGRAPVDDGRRSADTDGTREVHALSDEIQQTPQQLTLVATATSVTITDDQGVTRTFAVKNVKEQIDLMVAKVDVTSTWKDGWLTLEFSAGKSMKLVESYAVELPGGHLVVTLTVTRPKNQGGQAAPITRVYDRMPLPEPDGHRPAR